MTFENYTYYEANYKISTRNDQNKYSPKYILDIQMISQIYRKHKTVVKKKHSTILK